MKRSIHNLLLERFSSKVSDLTGGTEGFAAAMGLVLLWLIAGPFCHFSQTWQLFINTITTTITFLMVFLIERAEKKDAEALHLKLNLLIKKLDADKTYLDIEDKSEAKLQSEKTKDRQTAEVSRQLAKTQEQT